MKDMTHEDVATRPCRKTAIAQAAKVDEPFTVQTMEGLMTGRAGDYLMIGVRGERYICEASIFEQTYEWVQE